MGCSTVCTGPTAHHRLLGLRLLYHCGMSLPERVSASTLSSSNSHSVLPRETGVWAAILPLTDLLPEHQSWLPVPLLILGARVVSVLQSSVSVSACKAEKNTQTVAPATERALGCSRVSPTSCMAFFMAPGVLLTLGHSLEGAHEVLPRRPPISPPMRLPTEDPLGSSISIPWES